MDVGRRALWSAHLAAQQVDSAGGLRQQTLFEAWGLPLPAADVPVPLPPSPVQFACRVAIVRFWQRLDDFVSGLPGGERPWKGSAGIAPDHPFICSVADSPESFAVNLPAAHALLLDGAVAVDLP